MTAARSIALPSPAPSATSPRSRPMTHLRPLAAALALPFLLQPAQADTLLQVVIDHSGVLHDEQDSQGKTSFNRFVEAFLADLARAHRRDRDTTRVVLISAVEPPHILWSGNATDFYREGLRDRAVAAVVTGTPNGCNNLPVALAEVQANLSLTPAETSVVHVITSGVHSGPGCAELTQEGYVDLVQTTDPGIAEALVGVASTVSSMSVHFLTATQRRGLLDVADWSAVSASLRAQGQGTGF